VEIIDYHTVGFARLARNWDKLLARQAAATEPGKFIAFPSYEWPSLKYGDHNVYAAGPELQLTDAPDLPALRAQARQQAAIVIPHHIGYAAGYRGIDWQHFRDDTSPFVEIYSLHGCSESDAAPYPMLHDMGPRDAGSTADAGWELGHRFGVIGSTDHHTERACAWRSLTLGNLSMRHATTQGLSLELDAPLTTTITVEANSQRFTYQLGELLHAGRSHYLRGWLSEAIRIGPLVPFGECTHAAELADAPDRPVDV